MNENTQLQNTTEDTAVDNAQQPTPQTLLTPNVDVFEGEHSYLLLADLPGVAPEDLQIHLEARELSLEATRRADDLVSAVLFKRKLTLPQAIDADKIEASLKQGVLHVTLPRAPETLPRRIPVHVN